MLERIFHKRYFFKDYKRITSLFNNNVFSISDLENLFVDKYNLILYNPLINGDIRYDLLVSGYEEPEWRDINGYKYAYFNGKVALAYTPRTTDAKITITWWCIPLSIPSGSPSFSWQKRCGCVLGTSCPGAPSGDFSVGYDETQKMYVWRDKTTSWLSGQTNVFDGKWHFGSAILNGTNIHIFTDGNYEGTIENADKAVICDKYGYWVTGQMPYDYKWKFWGASSFIGYLAFLRVYYGILTESEIKEIYKKEQKFLKPIL